MNSPDTPTKITLDWKASEEGLTPHLLVGSIEQKVAWAAQEGGQRAFLACHLPEVLAEGNRGASKTDALLMDFAQDCGQGYGAEWHGMLFRHTYPQLRDVVVKTQKWFPRIFPGIRFTAGNQLVWTWPDGEFLTLGFFSRPEDFRNYQGFSIPWIGWEELTNWADDTCYKLMKSCCRSADPRVAKIARMRATANAYGIGHNFVKRRFRLPILPGRTVGEIIRDSYDREGNLEEPRCAIHFDLSENKILLAAQPDYLNKVKAAARNESEYRAWVYDDWDIVAGGMFDAVYQPKVHIVPNFPLTRIPESWYIDRSYDHGQSKPFSVGWWAESSGEPLIHNGHVYGQVRGDLYRIAEWYGWTGEDNKGLDLVATAIGRGVLDREADWGLSGRVHPGPADGSIFNKDASGKSSTASDMAGVGCHWERADQTPGSRKQGWERIRQLMVASTAYPREEPGIFWLERCEQSRRTLFVLPRDEKDMDDVDTESEDHVGDETRYRVRHQRSIAQIGAF